VGKRADFAWKVGGEQGEGIDSTGEIFGLALHRLGHAVYAYRHYMSLIKGGHTYYKLRVTPEIRRHHADDTDVLIAFDQYTIDFNLDSMAPGGLIIYDSRFEARVPDDAGVQLLAVPMTEMAREAGGAIMKNMVAVGVSAAIVGLDPEAFRPLIAERFGDKGEKVVAQNMALVRQGYECCIDAGRRFELPPPLAEPGPRPFMNGNDATALGAVTAGCRLLFQYPITPATDIMYWVLANLPEMGGAVVQAEDEIAAINMAIGANYAGVRAMTATSGPGFSLMQEALGLAGISETPVVVVNVQRAGPSTGMPTKTEQSDLNEMLYGSHGEFPRIVLMPATVEDSFKLAAEAFNLADRFQCPVILGSDLYLAGSRQTIMGLDYDQVPIDRGLILSREDLERLANGPYRRYRLTEDGISPRTLPGMPKGQFVGMSNEHEAESNAETEDAAMRRLQMEKRMRKLDRFDRWDLSLFYDGDEEPQLLLLGMGSSYGPMEEAREELAARGIPVGHLHLRLLRPFPKAQVLPYIQKAAKVLVVENNFTGQLQELLQKELGHHDRYEGCRKYDGNPFTVDEIVARALQVVDSIRPVSEVS